MGGACNVSKLQCKNTKFLRHRTIKHIILNWKVTQFKFRMKYKTTQFKTARILMCFDGWRKWRQQGTMQNTKLQKDIKQRNTKPLNSKLKVTIQILNVIQNYSIENCKDTCVFWWAAQVTPWSEWRLQFHRIVTFDVRPVSQVSQPGGDMGWQQQKKLERFHSQWKTASTDTSDNTHWRKIKEMHIGEKSNNCNIKTGGNNKI